MNKVLLTNATAKKLYKYAKTFKIFDYHCHLSVKEMYENKPYKNLTEIWLKGDHYKWRQMRTFGVAEELITGDASDYDKFYAYISMLETAVGNPLYLWSKLELEFYFGIKYPLTRTYAKRIWDKANKVIEETKFSPLSAIAMSNVDTVCTTEEIYCDLMYHRLLRENAAIKTKILPAFRGDRAINIDSPEFIKNIEKLGNVSNFVIRTLEDMEDALCKRLDAFKEQGAVTTDFAIEGLRYFRASREDADVIFRAALKGEVRDIDTYKNYMIRFLLGECYKRGFSVQLHIGAMRNNNTAMNLRLGADTGFDSISTEEYQTGLKLLLDDLNTSGILGKTIIFNLNPADNEYVGTLIGCFQGNEEGVKGKIQMGAAWWFNDTKNGILNHFKALSELSHFGSFLGMLTDSRSFISYTRHDYFRRLMCSYVGELVEKGEFVKDMGVLRKVVGEISYLNAKRYFAIHE
ncbi:MAG TPA: glucuronate isomerase [Clostridiales bacterium]|nr:glucuronate isomerase [Clostridiales bacterium]